MNEALAKIYQCTKHLFLHVDKDKFFADREFKGHSDGLSLGVMKLVIGYYIKPYNMVIKFNGNEELQDLQYSPRIRKELLYSYYTKECTNDSNIVPNDLIAGLYFPNNEIGDTIDIEFLDTKLSTITITDKNKIYLPLDNVYFIHHILAHSNPKIINSRDVSFYTVHICLDTNVRKLVLESFCYHQLKNGITYNTQGMYLSMTKDPIIEMNYPQIASAKVIQKAWRNYQKRKYEQYMDDLINDDMIIEIYI